VLPALQSDQVREVSAAGRCGIPKSATALALNVTVISPTASGHLEIGNDPCRLAATSTLNFAASQTRANNGLVRLSRDGRQRFSALASLPPGQQADLALDVVGYFE